MWVLSENTIINIAVLIKIDLHSAIMFRVFSNLVTSGNISPMAYRLTAAHVTWAWRCK
jgi:hypothetical protein